MKADYVSICADCGTTILPGAEIEHADPAPAGGFRWRHATCPPEPLEGDTCPACWLRRSVSGECGCDQ